MNIDDIFTPRFVLRALGGAVLGIALFTATCASCVVVPAGHVGVRLRFGEASPAELPEGLHFKVPFVDAVEAVDVRVEKVEEQASAASKDLQMITTKVAVAHALDPRFVADAWSRIGDRARIAGAIVAPAVQESVKAVTARRPAEELVTQRQAVRDEVVVAIREYIDRASDEAGVAGIVKINSVAITDFKFSDDFDKAIEAKVKAEQDALKAENDKTRRMTDADAAAYEQERAAKARATAIDAESIARAAAIEREAKALRDRPELLRLRTIEKWNGSVPHFVGAGGVVPMLDVLDERAGGLR